MLIIISFENNCVVWNSVGWGDNPRAMAEAKAAINAGNTPDEVIELLMEAGFDVAEPLGW